MKRILIVGSLLLGASFASLVAHAEPELKGSPNELQRFLHPVEKSISITKYAEKVAFKDIAVLSLSVTTKDKKLAQSLKKNSELRKKITSELVAKGIKADNIKNANFSTAPDYGWFGDKPDSYKSSNTLTIRIDSELKLENVANIVDQYDEVTLLKTEYEHSEKERYLQEVAEEALAKVLDQKAFYAKKLGVELVVDSFITQDTHVEEASPRRYGRVEKQRATLSTFDEAPAYSSESKNTSFEKLTYRATATVNFLIKK